MSKKFTEEQYQKIVESNDDKANLELFITLAIANPLTREWAHDKFVEKDKKYIWTSKKKDNEGQFARVYNGGSGMISTYPSRKFNINTHQEEQLSESEIKEWGYNPEMFDREEVQ